MKRLVTKDRAEALNHDWEALKQQRDLVCSAYAAVITIISTDIYLLCFWDGWEVLRSARLYACLCLSVCMSVCLSARISQKQHVKTLRNFLYMLPMAAARSSSDDNAIRYVFFRFCGWQCFHTMRSVGQCQSDNGMFCRVRQVAALVGGAHRPCRSELCYHRLSCIIWCLFLVRKTHVDLYCNF